MASVWYSISYVPPETPKSPPLLILQPFRDTSCNFEELLAVDEKVVMRSLPRRRRSQGQR